MMPFVGYLRYLIIGLLLGGPLSFAYADYQITGSVILANGISAACATAVQAVGQPSVGKIYPTKVAVDIGVMADTPYSVSCSGYTLTRSSSGEGPNNHWRVIYETGASQIQLGLSYVGLADCVAPLIRQTDGSCGCPEGKEAVGGQCLTICPSGYHRHSPDDGQCEKDCIGEQFQESSGKCSCAIGNSNQVVSFTGGMTGQGCNNGCLYQLGSFAVGFAGGSASQTSYTWGKKTGAICGANTTLTPAPTLIDKTTLPPSDTSGTGSDGSTPDPKNTADNNKDPMACGAAGGSWGSYNGVGKCLTPDANNPLSTTKPSTSTTTNSDGSSTTTNGQTTTTCDGKSCTTTTTTETNSTGPNGSSSSTTTSTGSGSGAGSGAGAGDGSDGQDKGDCSLEPNAPYCKAGVLKEKGTFDSATQNTELDAVKARLRAKFSEIKSAASSLFESGVAAGGGGLPCFQPVSVLGQNFNLCFTQYSDKLTPIGGYLIFAASLLAVFIVLRR